GLRERLDIEARFAFITVRFRQEYAFAVGAGLGAEPDATRYDYSTTSYDPIGGTDDVAGPGLQLGTAITNDGVHDGPATLATAANGTRVMAWVRDAPVDSPDLQYIAVAISKDGGRTWGDPTIISGSAGLNLDPVVSIDGAGRAVVAWSNGNADPLVNQPPG